MQNYWYEKLRIAQRELQPKSSRKLTLLTQNSKWTQDASPNCIVNLSDKVIDQYTLCVLNLGYGMSFSYTDKTGDNATIAKSFCNLEKNSILLSEVINFYKGII